MANISIILVAAALTSLAGTEWGPEADGKPEQYIQFKESDVTGQGGCNRFGGRYTFDGHALKIGPLASTRMACAPEVMDAEQAWFQMLEHASAAEATVTKLVLKDQSGAVIATLRRKDWD
jgi:putative lipoprotein